MVEKASNISIKSPHPNIAFALQWRLEQIVIAMAKKLSEETGSNNFCLAGGVAMNCVMNGKLAQQEFCEDIYVQPAASDNGVSLGAALLLAIKITILYLRRWSICVGSKLLK